MRRLTIFVDPLLVEIAGPEIDWTWRFLLSSVGYAWQQVPGTTASCDIAYVVDGRPRPDALLTIRSQGERWRNRRAGWTGMARDAAALFEPSNGGLNCVRDLILDAYQFASGEVEREYPADVHGHVDLTAAPVYRGVLLEAPVSRVAVELERVLAALGLPPPVPRWPSGKGAACSMTHDVDYPEVVRWLEPIRVVTRLGIGSIGSAWAVAAGTRGHWHIESWVALEESFDLRSAFFFVARKGSLVEYAIGTPDPFYDVRTERYRTVLRGLADRGFEIGLHASYRAFERTDRLVRERQRLEESAGRSIEGNRHHYWHLDPADPSATLALHERAGFRYDASLTHERYAGWRGGISWPYYPFVPSIGREIGTLQLPTAWVDDHGFRRRHDNAGAGQPLDRLIETTLEQEGLLMVDVHDYVFDERLFPGRLAQFTSLCRTLASRSDVWIAKPADIAVHWSRRYRELVAQSVGLDGERRSWTISPAAVRGEDSAVA